MKQAEITVLMPAYNPGIYLKEAVDSILAQSLKEIELLIIDDGTTDGSINAIKEIIDPRIRVLTNRYNEGLVSTLNLGLAAAKSRYIARMDSDDIAHPERLITQLTFMKENPDVAICGTWSRTFGDNVSSWETKYPKNHNDIIAHMLFNTCITHPSVMLDRVKLQQNDLFYSESNLHAEDYDLWTRAAHKVKLANIPKILLDYRVHATQVSISHKEKQIQSARKIRANLIKTLSKSVNIGNLEIHHAIAEYDWAKRPSFSEAATQWLKHLSTCIQIDRPDLWPSVHLYCKAKALEINRHCHGKKNKWQRMLLKYTF